MTYAAKATDEEQPFFNAKESGVASRRWKVLNFSPARKEEVHNYVELAGFLYERRRRTGGH